MHASHSSITQQQYLRKTSLPSAQNIQVDNLKIPKHPQVVPVVENQSVCNSTITDRNNLKQRQCRFCGEEKLHYELIDFTKDEETRDEYLLKLEFLKIDYIDFSNSLLPTATCECCYNALHDAYEFFKKVEQVQIDLNDLYNAQINKENTDTNVKKEIETDEEIEIEVEEIDCDTNTGEYFKLLTTYKAIQTQITKADQHLASCSIKTQNVTQTPENNLLSNGKPMKLSETQSNESKDATVDVNDHSTLNCKIPKLDDATNIKELRTETDLTYNVTTHDATNTSISNNGKVIKSKPVEDLTIQTEGAGIQDNLDKHTEFISWEDYKWTCLHCNEEFKSMSEVRIHSKEVHNVCFGFKCVNCPEQYRTFNAFVEHIRDKHYESLRLYCQYCNRKFEDPEQCLTHTFSHWTETAVCEYCGEVLDNFEALERHKQVFSRIKQPPKISRRVPNQVFHNTRSWNDYEWSCQDCWMKMPDVSSLRTHVREVHKKCFAMRCVDCVAVFRHYTQFAEHVRQHRQRLYKHCHFCDMHFDTKVQLDSHVKDHWSNAQRPCHGCGQIFADNTELLQHIIQYKVPNVNGIPHFEDKSTTCHICQQKFKTKYSVKSHLRHVHKIQTQRNVICHTCGKAFENYSSMQNHASVHNDKTEECKLCGKRFACKKRLKEHATTHKEEKPFTCDICKQTFAKKCGVLNHIRRYHMSANIKRHFKCKFCTKSFISTTSLKRHERQHTGARPYACEVCERTFTCWGNCNKHMIRMHGVTLAKRKLTARGKLDVINKKTGETKDLASDRNAEEWLNEIVAENKTLQGNRRPL